MVAVAYTNQGKTDVALLYQREIALLNDPEAFLSHADAHRLNNSASDAPCHVDFDRRRLYLRDNAMRPSTLPTDWLVFVLLS